jgi:hypothetical protein
MDSTNLFISEFCQWAKSVQVPTKSTSKLSRALRRAIDVKLVADDDEREIAVRQLIGSEGLRCEFAAEDLWVIRSDDGWLEAGAVGPDWRRGWRNFDKDEYVTDLISDFFYFARQYVHRGRAASIIGAIAATYDKACDFRYGTIKLYQFHVDELRNVDRKGLSLTKSTSKTRGTSSRSRQFSTWVNAINGLDPYVQRAIFQLWRATALQSSGFVEEAVTALDGLTSIAAIFLQDRLSIPGQTRDQLAAHLGLGKKDASNLEVLCQLRCDFGAHPSRSKWWDFAELYDEDIEEMRETAKKLLWQLCKFERLHRVVEPSPPTWSVWFRQNASMLFNSVWFKHIR